MESTWSDCKRLQFWRNRSQTVCTSDVTNENTGGYMPYGGNYFRPNSKMGEYQIGMLLTYINEENRLIARMVSLANIFAHVPDLYDELITCDNIFGNDPRIVIKYGDISPDIRQMVETAYKMSCTRKKDSYLI